MPEQKQDEQPNIKCLGVHLVEAVFRLNGESASKKDLNGEYEVQFSLGVNDKTPGRADCWAGINLVSKNHPNIATITVKVAARFEGDPDQLKTFAPNSGVFLLPYIRTYISTITGWGPMNPVIVPLMNVTPSALKFLKDEAKPSEA